MENKRMKNSIPDTFKSDMSSGDLGVSAKGVIPLRYFPSVNSKSDNTDPIKLNTESNGVRTSELGGDEEKQVKEADLKYETERDVENADSVSSTSSTSTLQKYQKIVKLVLLGLGVVGYFVYFTLALIWNFDRAIPLLVITILAVVIASKRLVVKLWTHYTSSSSQSHDQVLRRCSCVYSVHRKLGRLLDKKPVKISCYVLAVAAMLTYIIAKNYSSLENLKPALGLISIVLFSWLVSYDRTKIKWRPVIWGLGMQMVLGLIVLRTTEGANVFNFLGHQIEVFLNYVVAGVKFVFGDKYEEFFFAFKLMPTVIFMSSIISIAYHYGIMQWIINGIAYAMSVTMATTAAESTSTAACIFLGQPEASLTIKPFLHLMTRSELFAILTAGFASVTADVFSLFVNYGMSSSDIITAVLMSAPAGMAVSKIICPETEVSLTKTHKQINIGKTGKSSQNVVDAAVTGAQDAVVIIASVVATIIAFLSIFAFLNAVVTYLGSLVNIEGLTIDGIISYPLMPVVYLMGVPWHDCRAIGEIVGLKTFVNELVAYERLNEMVKAGQIITKRSEIVANYALCGFSNPTAMGVSLGGLSAMVPEKKMVLAKIVLMAWLAGSLACFMTASWAGLLYQEDISETLVNSTLGQNVDGNMTSTH